MKHKNFFTFNPPPSYFTYPIHLRQSARSPFFSSIPAQSQISALAKGFVRELSGLLAIPDDFIAILFNSEPEFQSFIADIFFHDRSFIPVHGERGKEYSNQLKMRKFHPSVANWNPNINFERHKVTPGNLPLYIFMNEPASGSLLNFKTVTKLKMVHPDSFIHVDLTSALPGILIALKELPSFSFRFNTSFGIPGNQIIWFLSPDLYNSLAMTYEGRYPLTGLQALDKNFLIAGNADLLFIDVCQKVIGDLISRTIKNISNETIYKYTIFEQAVTSNDVLSFSIKEISNRSPVTMVLDYHGESGNVAGELERHGIIVDWLDTNRNQQKFRITNFPVHSKEQFELLADLLSGIK